MSQSLFPQRASHFSQPYRGANARHSPTKGWPVVPRGTELRTTQERTEPSYRGTEELPTENQRWNHAGRRQGGLVRCQHSIRLLKVLQSCLLACKLPPRGVGGAKGGCTAHVTMETPAYCLLWSIPGTP